jgi:hypothetical protein
LAPGAVKPIAEAPQMGSGDPSLSLPITTQALGESLIRIPHLLEISDNYVRISLVTWNAPLLDLFIIADGSWANVNKCALTYVV